MTAYIPITDQIRLRSDERQWIVESPRGARSNDSDVGVQERAERWKVWGYYPSLNGAINALYTLQLRRCDADSLEHLQEESRRILKEITDGLGVKYNLTVEAA